MIPEDEMMRALKEMMNGLNKFLNSSREQRRELTTSVNNLGHRMDLLARDVHQLQRALTQPRLDGGREATELERVVGGLVGSVEGVKDSIAILSRIATSQRSDLNEGDEIKHIEVDKAFHHFCEQSLMNAAIETCAFNPSAVVDERDLAWRIRLLGEAILGEQWRDSTEDALPKWLRKQGLRVKPEVIVELVVEARHLRTLSTKTGHEIRWDFGGESNTQLDPERQSVWVGCPADGIVDFVVTPAYIYRTATAEKIYRKQQVFTWQPMPAMSPEPAVAGPADEETGPDPVGEHQSERGPDRETK